jgi:two-component system sensor histidine kinase TtrS
MGEVFLQVSIKSKLGLLFICIFMNAAPSFAQSVQTADANISGKRASIGVLAFRGNDSAREQWASLTAFLSDNIDGWSFDLVPVTLSSVHQELDTNKIQFLITNPGHYVTLAAQYNLTALATRERWSKLAGGYFSKFGTVVFVKSDSNIVSLNDVKGRRVAAVSPDAFGGFQVAWSELKKQGVDTFRDLNSLRFVGFPHDQIIEAVALGEVDVGIIRSGLLEILADEGTIQLDDFRVLNRQDQFNFPYQLSSALFSEWPFATLPTVDKKLREQVLMTLLQSQEAALVAKYGLEDIWSTPQSYEKARSLVQEYQKRLATAANQNEMKSNSLVILLATISLISLMTLAGYIFRRSFKAPDFTNVEDVSKNVLDEFQHYEEKLRTLTAREREILRLVCCGLPTKSIALELGISPKTVEFHRTNLLQKTEAGTTAHLVQIATHLGYDQGVSLG